MKRTDTLSALALLLLIALPVFAQPSIFIREPLFHAGRFHNLEWRSIGPYRGGRSVAVAGVPGRPLLYYMGTTGGGLWKTTDAGLGWRNISDGYFLTGSIGAIAVAPSDANILYVGAGEHPVRGAMSTHGDGVYKSTDGGETWKNIGLPESRHIAGIEVHPDNPDLVFVAVQGAAFGPSVERGVYKSENGGATWRRVLYVDASTGAADLCMDPNNPRILYAGMWDHQRTPWSVRSGGPGSGIYQSLDGGESWKKLTSGLPANLGKVAITVSPARSQRLYANVEAAGDRGGVYRSDDSGVTWRQVSNDRSTVTRAWYYIEIVADPRDPETVYVLNAPLLRSEDGGQTFDPVPNPHTDQHALWINPADPENLLLGNDGGACVSFNGGASWSSQYNQPTGQFYRVIADRQFPYRVYSGQQDNTTITIPSRTTEAGIGSGDWQSVGGCESGFLAFDPDAPEMIFGSCFQGRLSRYDAATGISRDIMAYPALHLGDSPADMRYRFNWNAPVVASPHDPSVIYHAGNVVFRTRNEGRSWEVISPDLTRDDPARQGPGGAPYTNEGAGGEVYNTISYLACSPHQPGVIWAGTDDGRVHLTRDEGESWREVTPPGMEEGCVNAIEVSPHDPAAAFLAVHRYKWNDLRPLIYYTDDYGLTWSLISHGIDSEHFVRVVREDPARPGLLYAGTEGGLYLSFDFGREWHRFQLNLPVCPITDLAVHQGDLVAATMGRGLWILDDLSALQQSGGRLGSVTRLFDPRPAVRFEAALPEGRVPGLGQNPPNGLAIDYYLPVAPDTARLRLQILGAAGKIIRDFSSSASVPPSLPAQRGVNRFYWDLRRASLPALPDLYMPEEGRGSRVGPGTYVARLIHAEDTLEQVVTVTVDPRLLYEPADYAGQQEMLRALDSLLADLHRSVLRMQEVDRQLGVLLGRLDAQPAAASLVREGTDLRQTICALKNRLVQPAQRTQQDVIHYPNRLNAQMLDLRVRLDTHEPMVTAGARERFADLLAEWRSCAAGIKEVLDEKVPAFNRHYRELQLPVLVVPEE